MPRESPTAPWTAGDVRVRRVRGPRADGLVYWRAEAKTSDGPRLVWAGWGRRLDPALVRELLDGVRRLSAEAEREDAPTVRYLLGVWKAHQRARADASEIAESSFVAYAATCRRLSESLGSVLLRCLDREVVARYQRDRLAAGLAPATVTNDVAVLTYAWDHGRTFGLVDYPLAVPDAPRPRRVRSSYTPTPAEVLAVLEHASPRWVRAAVAVGYGTGARLGEIGALVWSDVDLARRTIRFRGKTGERVVPVSADVIRELGEPGVSSQSVLGVSPAVVQGGLQRQIARAAAKAKVPPWSPHALRRLACDTLYGGRVDPGVAGKLLGHSPAVALQHYRTPREEQLRDALVTSGLGKIPEGKVIRLASQGGVTGTGNTDGDDLG